MSTEHEHEHEHDRTQFLDQAEAPTAKIAPAAEPDGAGPTPAPPTGPVPAPVSYGGPNLNGPRIGVIVWGVILMLFGLAIIGMTLGRDVVEIELFTIGALFTAGAALLVGAVIATVRGRHGRESTP
jgi:hypothetical protein